MPMRKRSLRVSHETAASADLFRNNPSTYPGREIFPFSAWNEEGGTFQVPPFLYTQAARKAMIVLNRRQLEAFCFLDVKNADFFHDAACGSGKRMYFMKSSIS